MSHAKRGASVFFGVVGPPWSAYVIWHTAAYAVTRARKLLLTSFARPILIILGARARSFALLQTLFVPSQSFICQTFLD